MAKKKTTKKSGTNKSQAIRDQLAKTPDASANDIAAAASKVVGEEVLPGLVYNVKATSGGGTKKKKRRKKKVATKQAASPAANSGGVNAKLIKEAAELLSHAGDAKAAREALAVAEEVSKVLRK